MKIIPIHTPTRSLLKENFLKNNSKLFVRFLPSIALYEEKKDHNVYLLSYRIWRKKVVPKKTPKVMTNEGHPWKHGWGHSAPSNYDSTAFALLSVNKSDPSKRKVLQEHIPSNHTTRVDLRLLRKPSGSNSNKSKVYNVTYNSYGLLNPKTFDNNYRNMKSNVNPSVSTTKTSRARCTKPHPKAWTPTIVFRRHTRRF